MSREITRAEVFEYLLKHHYVPTPEEICLSDPNDCLAVLNPKDLSIIRMQMGDMDALKKRFGDPSGQKCYKLFFGLDEPCPKCGILKSAKTNIWIEQDPAKTMDILVHSRFVQENGKTVVRMVSRRITDQSEIWERIQNSVASRDLIMHSITFLASKTVPYDQKFTDILNWTASFIGASSAYLVMLYGQPKVYTTGIPHDNGKAIPTLDDFPKTLIRQVDVTMQRESFCYLPDAELLKENAPDIYDYLAPWGIKNLIILPIFNNDSLIGFAVYHNVKKHKSELLALSSISDAVATLADTINTKRTIEKNIYQDKLTGLFNFEGFKIKAGNILKKNPDKRFSLWTINIKEFRFFNEVFGFEKGDLTLKQIARILAKDLQKDECVCRVNGDIMSALFVCTSDSDIEFKFRSLLKEINKFTRENISPDYELNLCCGIYITEQNDLLSLNEMFNYASMAENAVENLPHSNLSTYDENMSVKRQFNMDIEMRMEKAMANNELFPYFQPQKTLFQHETPVIRAEALARWTNADGTIFAYPDQFIPVFEHTGQIVDMDHHIFECVCKTIRDLRTPDKKFNISINISRATMFRNGFIEFYEDTRKKYGIGYDEITLEFTEDIAVKDMNRFSSTIQTLRKLGFVCSMDDFGSGYSSLNALQNLEMDELKLDKAFFLEVTDGERKDIIVRNILELSSDLKMKTVAEGIENETELNHLKDLGCDFIQGYVYAKPMPLSQFKNWIADK